MPSIGRGFDSASKSPKSLSIFGNSMTVKEELTTSFDFHFTVFRNASEFKESFRVTSEFGMPIASSINLNAALEVSRTLALDQDVIIYVMHVVGVRKRETTEIDEGKFEEDTQFQHARKELSGNPYDFCGKYGDAFVKRLMYGGEVALVIKFKRSSLESNKRLVNALHLNISGVGDIQQAVNFLKDLVYYDLECDIYTQTKGFSAEQLPPSDPKKLEDLSAWLADFAERFHKIPAEEFQTPIGYEIASYGTILPAEAVAVVECAEIRARYFFAIFRCTNAIDYYINYFQWIGNTEQLESLQLKKQELDEIKSMFDARYIFAHPDMAQAIAKLKTIITELNAIVIPPKLINEFTSADLSRNRACIKWKVEHRSSPPFKMPDISDEFTFDNLIFEVLKDDQKPLKGNLSLLYSYNAQVPFGEDSHEIARQINIGTSKTTNIPPFQSGDSRVHDINFAYHLELRRSLINSTLETICLSPCAPTSEEDFRVRTYMGSKKPGRIMNLDG